MKKSEKHYRTILENADSAYYNNSPILTDEQYDVLYDEFKKLYPKSDYFSKIGSKPKNSPFSLVKHKIEMGSLLKVNNLEEVEFWYKKYALEKEIVWSEKIDGLSVSLFYKDGIFTQAISRGDGETGEDITKNVLKMNFNKKLKEKFTGFIRGEIVLLKNKFNEKYIDQKANPRNAAVGFVRRLDGIGCEDLSIYCYFIDKDFKNEIDKFSYLKKIGLKTPKHGICNHLDEIQKIWEMYEKKERELCEYETDGLCIYINSILQQNDLGIIDNRPRYARAYKFSPQSAISTLEDVIWQVGRTGRVTPVGKITPVNVAGALITNISLHNLAEIKRKSIVLGGIIHVERKGDVIPQITKCIETDISKPIPIIKKCPSCNESLSITKMSTKNEDDGFLFCYNDKCKEKNVQSLLFWIKTLDIKGFGEKMVEKLYDEKKVIKIIDFYSLSETDLSSLERSGDVLAKKLIKEINDKKQVTPEVFIKGLGFDGFGESDMKLIMERYKFNEIFSLKEEDFSSIHGIGIETSKKIVTGLNNKKTEIFELLKIIQLEEKKQGKLSGKSYCFSEVRDKDLEKQIIENGGSISNSVTKDLTMLIVKSLSGTSSKIEKAKKNNVKIIEIKDSSIIFD